jgi:hypothetical protein
MPRSSVSWNHFPLQLFWRNLNFCANSVGYWEKWKNVLHYNWTGHKKFVYNNQIFCLSNSNVDNKNSVYLANLSHLHEITMFLTSNCALSCSQIFTLNLKIYRSLFWVFHLYISELAFSNQFLFPMLLK